MSNDSAGVVAAKYAFGAATVYGGFEYILFQNPSDAYPNGFATLGGYTVLPGYVNSTAYTNNKILRVVWTGLGFALRRSRHRRRLLSLLSERLQHEALHRRRPSLRRAVTVR